MKGNIIVGKRLAQLRGELSIAGEEPWTQSRVAAATGLTDNMVGRLEQFCAGTIDAIIALLTFYHNRGYNISWIVLPDNSAVSKHLLDDANKAIDAQAVLDKLDELKDFIISQ